MPEAPLLEIESLTFRYRRATEPALRDLSLTLRDGEVLLVAGPSGCGKSTLIRAINGLIPHAYRGEMSGRVLFKSLNLRLNSEYADFQKVTPEIARRQGLPGE